MRGKLLLNDDPDSLDNTTRKKHDQVRLNVFHIQELLKQKHEMLKSADKELHEMNAEEMRKGKDELYEMNRKEVLNLYTEAKT